MSDPIAIRVSEAIDNMATVLAIEIFEGRIDAVAAAQSVTSALVELIDSRLAAARGDPR